MIFSIFIDLLHVAFVYRMSWQKKKKKSQQCKQADEDMNKGCADISKYGGVGEMRALHSKCSLAGFLGSLSLAESFSKCVRCEITGLRVVDVVAVFQCFSRAIRKHNTWHFHIDTTRALPLMYVTATPNDPFSCHSILGLLESINFYTRHVLGRLMLADACTAQMA